MIFAWEVIDQVPTLESHVCDFHRRHPRTIDMNCSCSLIVGYRLATAAEKKANLLKMKEKVQERMDELRAEQWYLDQMLEECP